MEVSLKVNKIIKMCCKKLIYLVWSFLFYMDVQLKTKLTWKLLVYLKFYLANSKTLNELTLTASKV
jgi:hypothetical protein